MDDISEVSKIITCNVEVVVKPVSPFIAGEGW